MQLIIVKIPILDSNSRPLNYESPLSLVIRAWSLLYIFVSISLPQFFFEISFPHSPPTYLPTYQPTYLPRVSKVVLYLCTFFYELSFSLSPLTYPPPIYLLTTYLPTHHLPTVSKVVFFLCTFLFSYRSHILPLPISLSLSLFLIVTIGTMQKATYISDLFSFLLRPFRNEGQE